MPAATLTIWRSLPAEPIETLFARSVFELEPSATELLWLAVACVPIATPFVTIVDALPTDAESPIAMLKLLLPFAPLFATASPGDVLFFVCGAVSESVLVSFSVVRG
nr:hypothetical protein [Ralstonia mannitolilytica]